MRGPFFVIRSVPGVAVVIQRMSVDGMLVASGRRWFFGRYARSEALTYINRGSR